MYVVLFEPEIPQNTGNIIRLCANVGCGLVMVKPLGFSLTDKNLKRAGLDYHAHVITDVCDSWSHFMSRYTPEKMWALTTKASKFYSSCQFTQNDFFLFGPETRGLPDYILQDMISNNLAIRIPMRPDSRSLNLANSVGIVLFEAYRQLSFPGFC